jgi:hypothetical protein
MGFKKYLLASVVLLILIAGYVASFNQQDYTLTIAELDFRQTLPIFIWIIVPAFILFVATVLHMIYYGAKGYFQRKATTNDIEKLTTVIKDRLLNKKSTVSFKTAELKELNNILNQVELSAGNISTSVSDVAKASELIAKIEDGTYVPAKDLKLSNDNPLVKQNTINRIKSDDNFATEVLKQSKSYDMDLVEIAFSQILENKSIETIKKVVADVELTNDMAKALLKKDSTSSKELAFTNSEILKVIQDNKFTNAELIAIAKNYERIMSPEQIIKLFEDIAAYDEALTNSYLYVLFEYQMIEQAREVLLNSQKDEYVIFKAMLDLRDAGKHQYSVDNLVIN